MASRSSSQVQCARRAPRGLSWLAWNLVRALRLGLGLAVLVAMGLGLFVHHVGLPEPLQQHLRLQLLTRGWDVTFSRLRLRWYRGLVAEGLHVCQAQGRDLGQFFAEEAEALLDWRALRSGQLKVRELTIHGGRVVLPVPGLSPPRLTQPSGAPPGRSPSTGSLRGDPVGLSGSGPMLCFNDIHAQVKFGAEADLELRHLQASCLGAHLHAVGVLKHPKGLQHWSWPTPTGQLTQVQRARYRALWQWLRSLRLDRASGLSVQFEIDGLRTNWVQASLRLNTAQLSWTTGTASNLSLQVQVRPGVEPTALPSLHAQLQAALCRAGPVQLSGLLGQAQGPLPIGPTLPAHSRLELQVAGLDSPPFQAKGLSLQGRLNMPSTNGWPWASVIQATAAVVRSPWIEGQTVQLAGRLDHGPTNFLPAACALELQTGPLITSNASAPWARFQAHTTLPGLDQWRLAAPNLSWPQRLSNLPCRATVWLSNALVRQWEADRLELQAHWQAPHLTLQAQTALYDGTAWAQARLDTDRGQGQFKLRSSFNPRPLCCLLATNLQQAIAACSWQSPPRLEIEGLLELPGITNLGTGAAASGAHLHQLQGRLELGPGAVEGISFEAVRAQFELTNQLWHVRDLVVVRPEGCLQADYAADPHSGRFYVRFQSSCDPLVVKPWLKDPRDRALLEDFRLSVPPRITGQLWGHHRQAHQLGLVAEVAATNFWFRNEPIQAYTATVAYSNRFLSFLQPQLHRAGERAWADGFGVDLAEQMLYLTNASGTLSPDALGRVIGPHVAAVLQPYRFDHPPQARVWGRVDLTGDRHTDKLHIELSGGPFHWRQFNWTSVQGRVDWVGQTVRLTNVQASFCGGQMTGHLEVDLAQRPGPVLAFGLGVTNVDLRRLMTDLGQSTNKLEGTLSGALTVSYANLDRSNSWQGHGQLQLTNGLIWDIPIFGIFSPVLNAVVPGLGNSRARHASATFTLANSVLHSHDLQIHATGMRMQYDLRVGFDQTIDGRVEAELLRDLPGLGRVVSKLFWPVTKLFEYRLSGTLDDPKPTPVFFVPRILLFPFRPLKTLEELFPQSSKPAASPNR